MGDFPEHFDSPEDAYIGFFEADRAEDAQAWAAVNSYPHVRVAAAGKSHSFSTLRDYAAAADWTARKATGWVYTRGRDPLRLHASADRVHLVAGWTRYNQDDQPILWNRVTYILTKPQASWGIQARFALGSYMEPDDEAAHLSAAQPAIDDVREFYAACERSDAEACERLCRFPMTDVGVGTVNRHQTAAEVVRDAKQGASIIRLDLSLAQAGNDGALVAVDAQYDDGASEQAIVLVGGPPGNWTIAGISRILTSGDG